MRCNSSRCAALLMAVVVIPSLKAHADESPTAGASAMSASGDDSSTTSAAAAVNKPTISARLGDQLVELVYQFPKLTHFLAIHADQLPQWVRDKISVDLIRRPIIIPPFEAFEPNALTNRGGKLVALKFVSGGTLMLKPRDRIAIDVLVVQESTGAVAMGSWSAGNPDFLYRPPIVLTHAIPRTRFEPGPATVGAIARHLDERGGVIQRWEWSREVELIINR